MDYTIPSLPMEISLETPRVLKKLSRAHEALAKLNEVAGCVPDQNDLLSMLLLDETKENSSIENVIGTYSVENIVSTGLNNIVSTGLNNIVSTGLNNIVSTGLNNIVKLPCKREGSLCSSAWSWLQ